LFYHLPFLDFLQILLSDPTEPDVLDPSEPEVSDPSEPEVARFIESNKGNPLLLDKDGFIFVANKKKKNSIFWTCRDYRTEKCPARAYTNGIHVTSWRSEHNHIKRPFYERRKKRCNNKLECPLCDKKFKTNPHLATQKKNIHGY
jgi:hypothetical protein